MRNMVQGYYGEIGDVIGGSFLVASSTAIPHPLLSIVSCCPSKCLMHSKQDVGNRLHDICPQLIYTNVIFPLTSPHQTTEKLARG